MKSRTVVLVILFVFVTLFNVVLKEAKAQGQNHSLIDPNIMPTWSAEFPSDSIRVIIGEREYKTDYEVHMFLGLMAFYYELKQYSSECYADSQDVGYDYITFDSLGMQRRGRESMWEYLQPSFLGFIEFLDNKFNIQQPKKTEKKGACLMVDRFIKSIRDEQDGFILDKPWRLDEKSLGVIIPVLRKSEEQRSYITLAEAKKIKVEDTGQIDYVLVTNMEDKPVLISRGEIFRGKTQERTAVHDHIIMPDESLRVFVRCVHASRGISMGSDMKYGGRTPYNINLNSQENTWNTISAYSMRVSAMNDSGKIVFGDSGNSNAAYFSVDSNVGLGNISHSDDLAATMDNLTESIKEAMKKIPYIKDQVGAVFFVENRVAGLDIYDLPDSWDAVKKDIIEKEGESFLKQDDDSMFTFNPDKAHDTLKSNLNVDFKEKVIYDKDYQVVEVRSDKLIGEAIIFKDKVIHLTMWKKLNK